MVQASGPILIKDSYFDGHCLLTNVAASGAMIMADGGMHIEWQVDQCASTDADVIIVELGTNDNNAGDMSALQARAESQIAELRATNPRARVYWMNVLPRWTDVGGGTEVDKSNIRAAIAAACAARGIFCIDTYTTPWITAADTSDGLHPTAGGQAKIGTALLAAL